MAVALDVASTIFNHSAAANLSGGAASITVGSGANRAVLGILCFSGDPGAFSSMQFTGPLTANQIGTTANSGTSYIALFGALNPASGAGFAMSGSWVNSVQYYNDVISFTGVDQTDWTTSFANYGSSGAQSSAGPASVTITSATNNFIVATGSGDGNAYATGTFNAGSTGAHSESNTNNHWYNYIAGAAPSIAMTANLNASGTWIQIGVNIVAVGQTGGGAVSSAFDQRIIRLNYNPWQ